jgi:hypothetical protein
MPTPSHVYLTWSRVCARLLPSWWNIWHESVRTLPPSIKNTFVELAVLISISLMFLFSQVFPMVWTFACFEVEATWSSQASILKRHVHCINTDPTYSQN